MSAAKANHRVILSLIALKGVRLLPFADAPGVPCGLSDARGSAAISARWHPQQHMSSPPLDLAGYLPPPRL